MSNIEKIKKLRNDTGISISEIKHALEEAKGDEKIAKELLRKRGLKKASRRKDKKTTSGRVESYIHLGGKIGVLLELRCETDFVAKTPQFQELAHELCLQIASLNPSEIKDLLFSVYIRDEKVKIADLIAEKINQFGEKIEVRRFQRFEVGEG